MNWRFWKRREQASPVAHPLERENHALLQEQATFLKGLQTGHLALQEQQQETVRLVNNLARMQYRWNQAQTEKLDRALQEQRDSSDREKSFETSVHGLLVLLDDMEAIVEHADTSVDNPWLGVIGQWQKQIKLLLQELGVEPISHLGTLFDPKTAEAMDTVSKEEAAQKVQSGWQGIFEPYTVVDIIRKGYRLVDGKVIRKAQVVTIEEEPHASN